jgi:hypothetical protein
MLQYISWPVEKSSRKMADCPADVRLRLFFSEKMIVPGGKL